MFAQIRPVVPLLVSAMLMVSGVALGNLLVPLRAHAEGWSASTIGVLSTCYSFSFTLGCIFMPRLVMRVGHVRVFGVILAMAAASLIMIPMMVSQPAWAALRALTGFCISGGYMIIESWLNERSTNTTRGAVFSFYMIACLLGNIGGQYMLPFSSPTEMTLFLVAALSFLFAMVPTGLSAAESPKPLATVALNFRAIYENSPAAVVGGFVAGLLFGTWSAFAALFASNQGYSGAAIATLMMSGSLGGLVFQYPLGRLSDHVDRRIVMILIGVVGALGSIVGAILMPKALVAVAVLYFILGGVLYPSYAINVAHANDHAKDGDFVSISGAMLVIYGLGAMSGPLMAGGAIDAIGFSAFFLVLALGCVAYAAFSFWRMLQRPSIPPEQRSEFQPQGINKTPTPQTYALDPRAEVE